MQSTEKWLPVVGYEGIYEVSDLGNLRSLDRVIGGQHKRGQAIRPVVASGGRRTVSMHFHGTQRTRLMHHLVLEAFVGPRPDGMEGCHNDGDASNNALENLRWDTHLANEADKRSHGTHNNTAKIACPRGHLLLPPNLVEADSARGYRKCRACNIARARAQRRKTSFPDEFADEKYRELMEDAWPTNPGPTSQRSLP